MPEFAVVHRSVARRSIGRQRSRYRSSRALDLSNDNRRTSPSVKRGGDGVPRFSLVSFACCDHAPLFSQFLREPLVKRTELFVTRIELRGLAVFREGRLLLTLYFEPDAQVVVRSGVVRLQANRFAQFGDRAVVVTLVVERLAEVVVG